MEQNIKVTITVDNAFKTAFYALGIYTTVKFLFSFTKAYKSALEAIKKNRNSFVTNFKDSDNEGE